MCIHAVMQTYHLAVKAIHSCLLLDYQATKVYALLLLNFHYYIYAHCESQHFEHAIF